MAEITNFLSMNFYKIISTEIIAHVLVCHRLILNPLMSCAAAIQCAQVISFRQDKYQVDKWVATNLGGPSIIISSELTTLIRTISVEEKFWFIGEYRTHWTESRGFSSDQLISLAYKKWRNEIGIAEKQKAEIPSCTRSMLCPCKCLRHVR
ncbi:hypothetical protein ACFE04_019892 [Oxalis oulophora]